ENIFVIDPDQQFGDFSRDRGWVFDLQQDIFVDAMFEIIEDASGCQFRGPYRQSVCIDPTHSDLLFSNNLSNVPANLLHVAAACQVAHTNCGPPEFGHQPCKMPVCPSRTLTMWHLEDVHHRLRADALQTVEACCSAHTFQPTGCAASAFAASNFSRNDTC